MLVLKNGIQYIWLKKNLYIIITIKKVREKKVQGVPQSQTAALPRPTERHTTNRLVE